MSDTFCPATMCPLFAADGSPWTGHKNEVMLVELHVVGGYDPTKERVVYWRHVVNLMGAELKLHVGKDGLCLPEGIIKPPFDILIIPMEPTNASRKA